MDQLLRNPRGPVANNNAATRQMVYEDFPPSSDWTHDSNCHVLLIDLPGFKREELKVRVDNLRKVTVSGERQVSENKYSRFKQIYELPEDSDIDNISGRFDGGLLFIIIPKKKVEGLMQQPKSEIHSANEIEEEKKHVHDKSGNKDDDKKNHEKKEAKHEESIDNKQNHEKKDDKCDEELKKDGEDKHDKKRDLPYVEKVDNMIKQGKEGALTGEVGKKMKEDWRKLTADRVKSKEELDTMMRTAIEKIKNNKTVIVTAVLAFSLGLYFSRKFQSGGQ
ncbi:Hsp20-like chaperones superfamily protein [Thalictrum thalictroides]|uniref:Hsp20-like chaperones superfamily protein n=1 Tax=Thalictrum thalictroides TaxID=46969 RepID=A0A7J6XC08_THATH|nr:Hsp20-like chaperones superfamily protein [Thalictrum thalictroides]